MLRDMLIDVGAKKLMNEGQGECVTLRRACWTACTANNFTTTIKNVYFVKKTFYIILHGVSLYTH
jgi:hypothetical protein